MKNLSGQKSNDSNVDLSYFIRSYSPMVEKTILLKFLETLPLIWWHFHGPRAYLYIVRQPTWSRVRHRKNQCVNKQVIYPLLLVPRKYHFWTEKSYKIFWQSLFVWFMKSLLNLLVNSGAHPETGSNLTLDFPMVWLIVFIPMAIFNQYDLLNMWSELFCKCLNVNIFLATPTHPHPSSIFSW